MNARLRLPTVLLAVATSAVVVGWIGTSTRQLRSADPPANMPYRSPASLAISPDGKTLYVADRTAARVTVVDAAAGAPRAEIPLQGEPRGLTLSADGKRLFVAERTAGSVAVIDVEQGKVVSRVAAGRWPTTVAVAPKSNRLFVGNQDDSSVMAFDLAADPPQPIGRVAVLREPTQIVPTPDEKYLLATNMLPHGVGTDATLAAEVSIIESANLSLAANVKLPPGSSCVQGACVSTDGKWAYVVHGLGRFNLPITQLERGWVNTFALSVIDVERKARTVTLLLDDLTQGAADPYAVVASRDGTKLWICHAGVHEISLIDIGKVHQLLAGKIPDNLAALKDGSLPNIWVRIQQNPQELAELENDLTALYIAGAIRRVPSGGVGPRAIVLSPDEQRLFVANYYSGSVAVLDAAEGRILSTIALGPQPEADAVRRGEMIFHDADHAFQRWHSCNSCHPNRGRSDGLRWDFLADGIGNPKDTMNLVWLHKTEPLNRRATVATAHDCARGGLAGTNMLVPTDAEVEDLYAYLISVAPEPSPLLAADGKLVAEAERGKALFEGKAGCVRCHPAPLYTDRKMHNVGVLSENEPDGRYDTPSLIEAYRTAPYLHDGRALTIEDVLREHNADNQHGKTNELSEQEIADLAKFIRSL